MPITDQYEQAQHRVLAYQTFRRGLRRLRDAEDLIRRALAQLERADHPLGPVDQENVNDTTAERLGLSQALLEKALAERAA